MAMEMVCGNCQGRLMVEQTGVVVACPHCGAHLQIGEVGQTPPPQMYPPHPDPSQGQYPPNYPQPNYPYPNYPPQPYPQYYPPQPDPQQQFGQHFPAPPQFDQPAPQPAPGSVPAAGPMSETTDFVLPPEIKQAVQEPASEAWLPKIDVSLPEPTKAGTSEQTAAPALTPPGTVPESEPIKMPSIIFETPPAPVEPAKPAPTAIWTANDVPTLPDVNAAPAVASTPPVTAPTPGPAPASPTPMAPPLAPPTPEMARESVQLPDFSNFGAAPAATSSGASAAPAAAIATLEIKAGGDDLPATDVSSAPASGPVITTSNEPRPAVVPKQLFVIVASYASAITIAFLYLVWKTWNGSPLDLPDRAPKFQNGKAAVSLYPDGQLPASHRLKLGESKQFGSVRVTPVKITKGKLEFTHHLNPQIKHPPSSGDVLKLWLKFENVSPDQTFPALDTEIVYRKIRDRTNNYLCLVKDQVEKGKRVSVYDWPVESEWEMKDQHLNVPLEPGQSVETYIPTNDERDLDELKGPLAWRVHFRKGYNRSSFRGVTTLVEVDFDSSEIKSES